MVHLLRHSLKYVPRRERERVARDLKPIYTAVDADAAAAELERFDEKWGKRFPVITQAWLNAWEYVIPFLAFPDEVRRVIYTTDESVKGSRAVRRRFSGVRSVQAASRGGADRLLWPRFGVGGRDRGRFRPCGGFAVGCGASGAAVSGR